MEFPFRHSFAFLFTFLSIPLLYQSRRLTRRFVEQHKGMTLSLYPVLDYWDSIPHHQQNKIPIKGTHVKWTSIARPLNIISTLTVTRRDLWPPPNPPFYRCLSSFPFLPCPSAIIIRGTVIDCVASSSSKMDEINLSHQTQFHI